MKNKLRVLVADMQPITPAVGGGRLRLLGLYHKLKPTIHCTYLGTYDWKGEPHREQRISRTLGEVIVPLSDAHFDIDARFRELLAGQSIIDSLFGILAPLSKDYCERLYVELERADAVVLAHPWVYPLVADRLDGRPLIYDSQNVEGLLKFEIYAGDPLSREVKKQVVAIEAALVEAADCIFCCSAEDKQLFASLYGAPQEKTILVPNGVFVEKLVPRSQSRASKPRLQAVFIGSDYLPNIEAAKFIANILAAAHPDVDFVLAGGVSGNAAVQAAARGKLNVIITGLLSDSERLDVLQRADFAINPMTSGSGTNIKMFDFMAVALPIIATPVGARGITKCEGLIVTEIEGFSTTVAALKSFNSAERNRLGILNRDLVCREFAWETLSVRAAEAIEEVHARGHAPRPTRANLACPSPVGAPATLPRKIGILSTYDIKCGIAAYTEDLVAGLRINNCDSHIFASCPLLAERLYRSLTPSSTGWLYDDSHFARSSIYTPFILRKAAQLQLDHINVQYHSGFFPFNKLLELLDAIAVTRISSSVVFHNSSSFSEEQFASIGKRDSTIFVHDLSEYQRIKHVARCCLLPFGIPDAPLSNGPEAATVGTFGFLRPHKGLFELISAFDLVRAAVPEARLKAFCAEYPSSDSRPETLRCMTLIAERQMQDYVELDTSFLPKEEALERLATCTVSVLPYHQVEEGASAAANYCIAARRPLITSRSKIFEPLGDVVYRLEGIDPGAIALAILGVLHNPALRADLEERVGRFAEERNWSRVAAQFLEAIDR